MTTDTLNKDQTTENIQTLVQKQRDFFAKGESLSIAFRKEQLQKLYSAIKTYESELIQALKIDLNKSDFEAYITEIGLVYDEIKLMLKKIDKLTKPRRMKTPIMASPAKSYVYKEPYGCVLIMSPWNYPFQLTMMPLIGAITAGNCAVIKPATDSMATTEVITKILAVFDEEYIAVVVGHRLVTKELLENKFDYIFFTGSTTVGKLVMEKASRHLTPVTLELGGKSPCIVDETADVALSAKRIMWGKLLNAGQTCVAPDYILVHESVKDALIEQMKKYIHQFFGESPEKNADYPKIINQKHFDRLTNLIKDRKDIWGGQANAETLQIAPAIFVDASWNDTIMEDEIFGPLMPIISYTDLNSIIEKIKQRPKPLALYLFTKSKINEEKVLKHISFGGGCINDTVLHVGNHYMPFGGVGESGMGTYHGVQSFETFSHSKNILKKSLYFDVFLRYAPFKNHLALLRKFF